jgi:hypothetical protein
MDPTVTVENMLTAGIVVMTAMGAGIGTYVKLNSKISDLFSSQEGLGRRTEKNEKLIGELFAKRDVLHELVIGIRSDVTVIKASIARMEK